jgi:hypothetical protein
MATKDRIYGGDTLPVAYECRMPNEEAENDSRGLPATPISAIIRIYNTTIGEFLEIGGVGVSYVNATIEPAEGSLPSDRGAVIRYVVPSVLTQEPGDYTLFMTATFSGGIVLTENRKYKVEEFR